MGNLLSKRKKILYRQSWTNINKIPVCEAYNVTWTTTSSSVFPYFFLLSNAILHTSLNTEEIRKNNKTFLLISIIFSINNSKTNSKLCNVKTSEKFWKWICNTKMLISAYKKIIGTFMSFIQIEEAKSSRDHVKKLFFISRSGFEWLEKCRSYTLFLNDESLQIFFQWNWKQHIFSLFLLY